jgi:hypothetical protein
MIFHINGQSHDAGLGGRPFGTATISAHRFVPTANHSAAGRVVAMNYKRAAFGNDFGLWRGSGVFSKLRFLE